MAKKKPGSKKPREGKKHEQMEAKKKGGKKPC